MSKTKFTDQITPLQKINFDNPTFHFFTKWIPTKSRASSEDLDQPVIPCGLIRVCMIEEALGPLLHIRAPSEG